MEIFTCENPRRVYNKYIDEYVWTNCGHCNACKKRRASRWVARLERERMCRRFCLFVTLTYNEESLPRLFFSSDGTSLVDSVRDVSVPFDELIFSSTADKQYFDSKMALCGIPYASVIDIQKFHKRLNKFFHDNVTQTYKNFRYFTVSEYGSTTLRPHFHSIYFTDDEQVASHFEEGVLSCWQFGRSDTQYVQKSANSYVAQYLNQLFDLPSFYTHRTLRPFFVCSKRPPIGGDYYNEDEFKDIFQNTRISQVKTRFAADTKLSHVPLLPCVENRLFPKIRAFGQISHSLRVALYGFVGKGWSWYRDFEEFRWSVFYMIRDSPNRLDIKCSELVQYFNCIVDGFSEKGITALRRFYYICKRVLTYCFEFHCSVEYYVSKIEEYWNKKEYNALNMFYRMQEVNENPEELVYCYPEFAYQNKEFITPKSDLNLFKRFIEQNSQDMSKRTKTHFKNGYFESLKVRSNQSYKLLINYLYAKKCNEVIEAFAAPVT